MYSIVTLSKAKANPKEADSEVQVITTLDKDGNTVFIPMNENNPEYKEYLKQKV